MKQLKKEQCVDLFVTDAEGSKFADTLSCEKKLQPKIRQVLSDEQNIQKRSALDALLGAFG